MLGYSLTLWTVTVQQLFSDTGLQQKPNAFWQKGMNGKEMALTTVIEVHQLMDNFNTSLKFEIYLLNFPTSMHALCLMNYVFQNLQVMPCSWQIQVSVIVGPPLWDLQCGLCNEQHLHCAVVKTCCFVLKKVLGNYISRGWYFCQ